MRKILDITLRLALTVALAVASAGCTHMDGDIGPLFGRWNLVALTADGVEQPLYDSDGTDADDVLLYTWSFQGELVWILTLYPHEDYADSWGTWTRTDSQLMLDYSHTGDDAHDKYTPPRELHLVEGGVTTLNITTLTSSHMTLWYVADNGVRYEYNLKKAY